ncbi:MAG: DUF2207 domain-containing protein [Candidatus Electrothrix sp. YB6]
MKSLRQLLAASILATLLLVLLLQSGQTVAAQKSPPFYWDFINVLIDVQQNGDMLITETQKYVFTGPHTNERYRYIPLDKVDGIDQIEVYEGEEKLAEETNVKNGQRWIKWRHDLNPPESHTFVLKYRVKGGIQVHGEEDWVYVKAIFKDRSAPIESGKVTVRLPDSLAGKITSFKNFGVPAEPRQIDERTVEFVAKGTLPPGQELEVRVAVPHGILALATPAILKEQPRKSAEYWRQQKKKYERIANSSKPPNPFIFTSIKIGIISVFSLIGILTFWCWLRDGLEEGKSVKQLVKNFMIFIGSVAIVIGMTWAAEAMKSITIPVHLNGLLWSILRLLLGALKIIMSFAALLIIPILLILFSIGEGGGSSSGGGYSGSGYAGGGGFGGGGSGGGGGGACGGGGG